MGKTYKIYVPNDPVCADDYIEVWYIGTQVVVYKFPGDNLDYPFSRECFERDYHVLGPDDKEVMKRLVSE